jgi:DNA (cytosine-5)-methyltransferase 3A
MAELKPLKVLSLFDGISCGMVALERAGIPVERYVAYEIEPNAIKISKKNYPQIEQCGDVFAADFTKYKGFDLLIGGSPCTHWSIANKKRETKAEGLGFDLFMQYVRALQESKCKHFLYENNNSISKEIKAEITKQLGVEPIMINSSLVSAQERKRCYWTNIPNIQQPKRKQIYLKDVLGIVNNEDCFDKIIMTRSELKVKVRKHYIDKQNLAVFLNEKKKLSNLSNKEIANFCNVPLTLAEHWFRQDKSFSIPKAEIWGNLKECLNINETFYDKAITEFEIKNTVFDMAKRIYHINGKHPTLTTLSGGHQRKTITDGEDLFYLEPIHCERLQTLPDNYTEGISDRQRFKCLGNGWTVDVIAHILKGLEENDNG